MKCEKTLRFDRDLVAEMGQVLLAELQVAMSMSRGATSTPTTRSRRHEHQHDNDDSNSESGRKDEVKHDRTIKRGFLSLFGSSNEGSADRNADLLKPGAIQKLILASCPRFLKLYEKFVEDHVAVQFLHDHFLEAGREAGVTLAWRRTEPRQFRTTRAFSDSQSSVEEGASKNCQLQKLDDKLVAVYYQYPPTLRVKVVVDEEEQEVRENDVRVSLDFRCFLADNFDFGFRLAGRGVAYSHERRKATYAATVERVDRRSGQPR
eukprot:g4332.t1